MGGVTIKGFKSLLIIVLITGTMAFSYTMEEVLEGVQITTFQEYDIPYIQWLNSAEGELKAGYDPFGQKGHLGAQASIKLFKHLDLSTSFAYLTDFASDSSVQFSLGVSYDFLSPSQAEKRRKEANKEVIKRQLEAVDLFFDYLKKKIMLPESDGNLMTSVKEKIEQVDLAYLAIQLEALSSLTDGEPQITGLSQYQPKKIDDDIVQTAVVRYLNLFSQSEGSDEKDSLYALFRTDYNTFLQGISAGIGGAYDCQRPIQSNVSDKLEEIRIRKNKLLHDVLTEVMPTIKAEYQRLEKEINGATAKIVSGEMSKEELNKMQSMYMDLENQYIEMTLEAV